MSTPTSPRTKRLWQTKFKALLVAREKANADVFVAIHEAREDGLTFAAIGSMTDTHPSGVPAKAAKGQRIAERRKRS